MEFADFVSTDGHDRRFQRFQGAFEFVGENAPAEGENAPAADENETEVEQPVESDEQAKLDAEACM